MLMIHIDRSKAPELHGIALGLIIDLVKDNEVVRSIRFREVINESMGDSEILRFVEQVPELHTTKFDTADASRWNVHVRGDRTAALREFHCNQHWDGKFSVPLTDILTR
jgi:hypothetical protein